MTVSFKDLCLLHLRDEAAAPFRPLGDLLNDPSHQVTWSTLQRVVHMDTLGLDTLRLLDNQGRLSADKLTFGRMATEFVADSKSERGSRGDRVYQNIFEVVWLHGFQQDYVVQTRSLYRGQRDSRWRQVSSLLRGESLDVQTLVNRLTHTESFVAAVRSRYEEFFTAPPSDDELLAVAQHYGFATPLLDYTSSLRVAAWFATSKAAEVTTPRSVIGVIHLLKYMPESVESQTIADNPGIATFGLLEGATIHVGRTSYLRPRLAAEDNRIARQQGLFVAGFQPRDLHGATLTSLHFWQEPGEVFEDPAANVTASYLLPDDSPLARLAKSVKEQLPPEDARSLTRGLGATILPEPGIFGSKGFALQAAITDSRVFFKSLEQHVSRLNDADYVRRTLGSMFDDYFRLSRIRADLGGVSPGQHAAMDPYRHAVSQLARLSGTDSAQLESATREAIPKPLRGFRDWPTDVAALLPAHSGERIALACSVYLASWELLQHVNGEQARDVATKARSILGLVDDWLGFTFKL